MKIMFPSTCTSLIRSGLRILLGFVLTVGTSAFLQAQGDLPSGTISGSGSVSYDYSLIFSDAVGATSPIGSVWYAWVPGFFYLPGTPTSAFAPAGWTASVFSDSVQYVANSPANDITAGQSLSGFGYLASFSPSQLAAASNSGVSVAYSGGLFSDAGKTFTVQIVAAPEPSSRTLLFSCGVAVLWFLRHRKMQTI